MLYELNDLIEGLVVKRPSKYIKTPYVADVLLMNNEVLAHTASLGCCGLVDNGASVLLGKMPIPKNKNTNQKCEYRVYLSICRDELHETIVGVHPKLAEDLVENALQMNFLSKLQGVKTYKRETPVYIEGKVDSRFDFSGIDNNDIPFIMEVKNVPLADYEDVTSIEKKKLDFSSREWNSKVAYFPDGYRKKKTDPVSPRALKHLRELMIIKKETNTRCIMCYVIQRNDVNRFTASIIDEEYRNTLKKSIEENIEIITLVVEWSRSGIATFVCDDLPIVFD
jgi:DNA-binding sugar fermentation-stimulating protein